MGVDLPRGRGLGLIGIWYVRKRDAAIKRAAALG